MATQNITTNIIELNKLFDSKIAMKQLTEAARQSTSAFLQFRAAAKIAADNYKISLDPVVRFTPLVKPTKRGKRYINPEQTEL